MIYFLFTDGEMNSMVRAENLEFQISLQIKCQSKNLPIKTYYLKRYDPWSHSVSEQILEILGIVFGK